MEDNLGQEVCALLSEGGHTAKEIAERVGCSLTTVYSWAKKLGVKPKREHRGPNANGPKSVCAQYDAEIREALESGEAKRAIARRLGIGRGALQCYCRVRGLKSHAPLGVPQEEAKVAASVARRSSWRYIGGYKNRNGSVEVECPCCKAHFTTNYTRLRQACPECEARRKREEEDALTQAKADRKAKREAKAAEQADRKRRWEETHKPHPCACCGAITTRPKYCSKRCSNKAQWQTKDVRRRTQIRANGPADTDISVMGLFRRDGGRCWICGMPCNPDDFTYKDSIFVAGGWYPSVDHVVPLSKGGVHKWDNVRLAHIRCNTAKSDKEWRIGVAT